MAKAQQIVTPAQVAGKYSAEDLEHAAESSREMIQQSKVLQTCIATMIASRRLYMVARSALDNEVTKGWECDDPELIIQTLVMSAQDKANERFQIEDLHRQCVGTVLPFIDIVLQQSRETGEDICPEEPDSEATDNDSRTTTQAMPEATGAAEAAGSPAGGSSSSE